MTTRGPETTILEIKFFFPNTGKKLRYRQKVKKSVKDKKAAESLEDPLHKKLLTQLK